MHFGVIMDANRLREVLDYAPESGVFTWKVSRSNVVAGTVAGNLHKNRYLYISIDRKRYRAHRLAWLYVHGKWPEGVIDHIDRVPSNNAIANLRDTTHQQNSQNMSVFKNNTSGIPGVHWNRIAKKWHAQIKHKRKCIYLGCFADFGLAVSARLNAEREFWNREVQP